LAALEKPDQDRDGLFIAYLPQSKDRFRLKDGVRIRQHLDQRLNGSGVLAFRQLVKSVEAGRPSFPERDPPGDDAAG